MTLSRAGQGMRDSTSRSPKVTSPTCPCEILDWPHIPPPGRRPSVRWLLRWVQLQPRSIQFCHLFTPPSARRPRRPETFNYICWQNDEVDELIEAGLEELDQDARARIYQQIGAIVATELPATLCLGGHRSRGTVRDLPDGGSRPRQPAVLLGDSTASAIRSRPPRHPAWARRPTSSASPAGGVHPGRHQRHFR